MKLLPCPFCGGEPEEDGGMFFEFYGHERQDYSIACKKCRAEVRCDVGEHEGADAPCSCHHDTRKICAEKWNRRAAMLQGADGYSPDGWVACSERMPETMVSVLVTGTWFHHAVAFWDGLSWCDLDFEPPVTHWMPLPAAPQQEVMP
ncbi:DUF551 domain-containing protein [Enterobacter roggenkampii]|uniref:DUF551 domain-containing protein n=1 Tax=Enterobacter roggenkampii TaxID=1812935 RepID=UPI00201865D6|nr:DUF551 domain-containing protein [Enterobacter roggenkampii]UQQ51920.1 DUF551 domain-containing protein [Enterobacter roggenkampii]UQQ53044.1 DUF551 domain-containing protein [Enterobacter roggenkampii]